MVLNSNEKSSFNFSVLYFQSGKLVTKMFSKIMEVVENKNVLVCVLIDEVESLAHARSQCVSGKKIFALKC